MTTSQEAGGSGPTGHTRLYVMIGDPIRQVKSPGNFNGIFRRRGIDAVLVALEIEAAGVPPFFNSLRSWTNCGGCIVTIPHKQTSARAVDQVTERAGALGAVNVVRRTENGQLIGDNVDGLGFVEAAHANDVDFFDKTVAIIGAGGAGSAIAYAIAARGPARLRLADENAARRDLLVSKLRRAFETIDISGGLATLDGVDVAINATPVGMNGDSRLPFPVATLSSRTFVADVVTAPEITPWLAAARGRGCQIQTGSDMAAAEVRLMAAHLGLNL